MSDPNHKKSLVFISAFLRSAKKEAKKSCVTISDVEIKKNPCCDQYDIVKKDLIVWSGFAYNADEALGDYIFREIHARAKSVVRFDGLEISPVAEFKDSGDIFCERVDDPSEAHFWSLYGHRPTGGVECIDDYDTEINATRAAVVLLEKYSNLWKHGLMRC
jgi:hypothetical protein